MPKGGKPLDTPLNLTNVKRDSLWDMGFTVTFKVSWDLWRGWRKGGREGRVMLMDLFRVRRRDWSLIRSLGMIS